LAALAAFGPTGLLRFWVYIRCCGCCRWRFRSYSESPFSDAKKVTQKALPRRTARSLKLGVPSLRDRSGRSGYGLLRCTSFRCVRLRRTVATLPHPDRSRNEACRRGKRSRAGSKAKTKAKPKAKARSKDRSLRQLLQLDRVLPQDQVGRQAAFASRLAPTKAKAKQRSCRGEAAPLNNERKLECF
jgi:hypothetical protein